MIEKCEAQSIYQHVILETRGFLGGLGVDLYPIKTGNLRGNFKHLDHRVVIS
jgi:hypothetical protein